MANEKERFIRFVSLGSNLISDYLPDAKRVPIHFNSAGKADIVVNRFWLILSLPIPYSLYWKYFRSK